MEQKYIEPIWDLFWFEVRGRDLILLPPNGCSGCPIPFATLALTPWFAQHTAQMWWTFLGCLVCPEAAPPHVLALPGSAPAGLWPPGPPLWSWFCFEVRGQLCPQHRTAPPWREMEGHLPIQSAHLQARFGAPSSSNRQPVSP